MLNDCDFGDKEIDSKIMCNLDYLTDSAYLMILKGMHTYRKNDLLPEQDVGRETEEDLTNVYLSNEVIEGCINRLSPPIRTRLKAPRFGISKMLIAGLGGICYDVDENRLNYKELGAHVREYPIFKFSNYYSEEDLITYLDNCTINTFRVTIEKLISSISWDYGKLVEQVREFEENITPNFLVCRRGLDKVFRSKLPL